VTRASEAFLVAALLLAITDWVAVVRGSKPVEYFFKPATIVALIGAAVALDPACRGQRWLFVAALVLSLAGDVFLMLPKDLFLFGLASFLVAHLAYVSGFLVTRARDLPLAVVAAVVVAAVLATAGRRIVGEVRRRHSGSPLPLAVGAYMAVISVMVVAAGVAGRPLALGGALFFYLSDALIAWNRFVKPLRWGPVAIIVTYHLAQIGLVASLAR
jgi:uncharacterized membrane protein YhhN